MIQRREIRIKSDLLTSELWQVLKINNHCESIMKNVEKAALKKYINNINDNFLCNCCQCEKSVFCRHYRLYLRAKINNIELNDYIVKEKADECLLFIDNYDIIFNKNNGGLDEL